MLSSLPPAVCDQKSHPYFGQNLLQIAMPMGGIGSGCICLNGHGGLQDFALYQRPAATALPDGWEYADAAFALLHIKGETSTTRLLEGALPVEKIYDQSLQAQGYRKGGHEGLPRFADCLFQAQYPFGEVRLSDPSVPLAVSVVGWNPFVPGDDVVSSLPAAILEYTFQNTSEEAVDFEFSYHLSHLAKGTSGWQGTRNSVLQEHGVLFSNTDEPHQDTFGTAALVSLRHAPRIKAHWFRGGWFDSLSVLWREVSTGAFQENDAPVRTGQDGRTGGSLLVPLSLQHGEAVTVPVALTWHFPNSSLCVGAPDASCGPDCACDPPPVSPTWRPFYAGLWGNAASVAGYVQQHFDSLRERTLAFKEALFSSTLPPVVLEAVACNLAILKSPTVLRQENGNVWAWEGCFTDHGSCHGSCTHVWNYAQALPHLFPKLERTLRSQELERSMNEQGHINFRAALPDGPVMHDYHAASDGQLGGIMKLYRDWHISGDTEWVRRLYPLAKRSLDFCIHAWDPEREGGLFEPHHNTYDIEFWGPDGMCGSIYVGALSAMARMAAALQQTEDEEEYGRMAVRAAQFMDENLFNGEYYQQHVQWEGLRDKSFVSLLASNTLDADTQALLEADGPKYQYGSGCLSDGIIGGWMAKIYGIDTPLNTAHVRSTLHSIFRYNYKPDLFAHACLQRPGYALGHESGLLLCSWPHGGKPTLPFVYSDEVWTGIEYQVASHLIEEGFVSEGLTMVEAVRGRYDGHVRNPFNEYECGSYYARALASYALLRAFSGFRYSAVDKTLWLAPKRDGGAFQTFFATMTGFGTAAVQDGYVTVTLVEGVLEIRALHITVKGVTHKLAWDVTAQAGIPVQRQVPPA